MELPLVGQFTVLRLVCASNGVEYNLRATSKVVSKRVRQVGVCLPGQVYLPAPDTIQCEQTDEVWTR